MRKLDAQFCSNSTEFNSLLLRIIVTTICNQTFVLRIQMVGPIVVNSEAKEK